MYCVFYSTGSIFSNTMMEHCRKKIQHLEKYISIPEETRVEVVAKIHPNDQKIEIDIPISSTIHLHAEATHEDFYAAANLAVKKLEDQCKRVKTRRQKVLYQEAPDNPFEIPESGLGDPLINGLSVPKDVPKGLTTFHIVFVDDDRETNAVVFDVDTSVDLWQADLFNMWEEYRIENKIPAESVVDCWSEWMLED